MLLAWTKQTQLTHVQETWKVKMLTVISEVLYSVKKKYSDLAKRINSTKKSIDSTRLNLHDLQAKRHALGKQGF